MPLERREGPGAVKRGCRCIVKFDGNDWRVAIYEHRICRMNPEESGTLCSISCDTSYSRVELSSVDLEGVTRDPRVEL